MKEDGFILQERHKTVRTAMCALGAVLTVMIIGSPLSLFLIPPHVQQPVPVPVVTTSVHIPALDDLIKETYADLETIYKEQTAAEESGCEVPVGWYWVKIERYRQLIRLYKLKIESIEAKPKPDAHNESTPDTITVQNP